MKYDIGIDYDVFVSELPALMEDPETNGKVVMYHKSVRCDDVYESIEDAWRAGALTYGLGNFCVQQVVPQVPVLIPTCWIVDQQNA